MITIPLHNTRACASATAGATAMFRHPVATVTRAGDAFRTELPPPTTTPPHSINPPSSHLPIDSAGDIVYGVFFNWPL